MPSAGKGKSVLSFKQITKLLTNPKQLWNTLGELGRSRLGTRGNRKQVPIAAQALCSTRFALLNDDDKLSVNHPLRQRVNRKNGALRPLQEAAAPRCEDAFPPTPPKGCLRGLSREKQRNRVGAHDRMVVTSEAQDKLREIQIQTVEFRRWEHQDARLLAGLGNIYMGPKVSASAEAVELWVKAKAQLKQHFSYDGTNLLLFEEQKLILVHPGTGLPLNWHYRWSKAGRSWFFNSKTKQKQWDIPKGTDVRKFDEFRREVH